MTEKTKNPAIWREMRRDWAKARAAHARDDMRALARVVSDASGLIALHRNAAGDEVLIPDTELFGKTRHRPLAVDARFHAWTEYTYAVDEAEIRVVTELKEIGHPVEDDEFGP